jgi:2-polyprenyl-6-methoxyphenol hydroxylase-like FAD-dependent oxidoreductase
MQTRDIAIIGGGIAGLTLAVSLRGSRFRCHIFDKKSEFKENGAAISVFPNALRVFRQYGILPEVLKAGTEIDKIFVLTDRGEILNRTEPRYHLPAICMYRADLYAILLKYAEATFYPDHTLESFENLPDGRVTLRFKNGVNKIFDALIGADGIDSVVRQGIIGDGKPTFRGYNIWRGVVKSDSFGISYAIATYGKGKRVGIVPIKKGEYGWWATCNEAFMQDDAPEGTHQKLQKLFHRWHHPVPEMMAETEYIIKDSPSDRAPTRGWSKGHCTLLGDAAHPTTPNLGQGGCLAIEGAYILGQVIRTYGITEAGFARYESVHFPRAKSIIDTSLQLGQIGQWQNSIAIFLRKLFLRFTPSSFTLRFLDRFFLYDVTTVKI